MSKLTPVELLTAQAMRAILGRRGLDTEPIERLIHSGEGQDFQAHVGAVKVTTAADTPDVINLRQFQDWIRLTTAEAQVLAALLFALTTNDDRR